MGRTSSVRIAGLALSAFLFVVPAAFAAKGGGAGGGKVATTATGSVSLVMVTDRDGDGALSWNDDITFDVTSSAAYPMVNLSCYQGSTLVKNQSAGFYPGYAWSKVYTLSDWYTWPGGAADCTAKLYYTGTKGDVTLDTMSFHVYA